MTKIFCLLISIIFWAGCGGATPYQKDSGEILFGDISGLIEGGFSETQLSENTWIVNFRGNGDTRKDRTVDLSLLRSAELTLENGFNYFAVAESGTDIRTKTYATQPLVKVFHDDISIHTSRKPTSSNTVIMFKEKPENTPNAFDAKFIIKSIKGKYDIK